MKKIICTLIFFLFSFPLYSNEKIVYLDVEKIMKESIAGKAAIAQIKKKREITISKFQKKEKEIIEKEKKLISQKNVLNEEEFKKKIQDLRGDIAKYQKDRNKASNDITQTRIKASTSLIKKLTPILEVYSKENSIKIIVQKKHIVMGSNEYDITSDILSLVNQKIKSIKVD
jgi:outer membrane protein